MFRKLIVGGMFLLMAVSSVGASQNDYVVDNGSGVTVRADINSVLQAIVSNNAGATEPSTMYPNMWWYDTSTGLLKRRDNANTAWSVVGLEASDTDGTLAANSDSKIATQKATKTYADTKVIAPATNTANSIPQWNGANSKLLKDGLVVGTSANNLVQLDASAKLPAVDGSALTGLASGSGKQVFTSSGTFTAPAGVTQVLVTMVGGGGAGSCGTINGTSGTNSSFSTLLVAKGGANGIKGDSGGAGGLGGGDSLANVSGTGIGMSGKAGATYGGAGGSNPLGSGGAGGVGAAPGGYGGYPLGYGAGSGGDDPAGSKGGGGGSGGCFVNYPITVTPGTGYTITIGVGGTGSGYDGYGYGWTKDGGPGICIVTW